MSRHDEAVADPLLVVDGLGKSYGQRDILRDLTFRVEAGEIVCLGGGNGAGKSTLLRCLAGLARADGSIRLHGRDPVRDRRARERLGYLPQTATLPENATPREALAFFASLRRGSAGPPPVGPPAGRSTGGRLAGDGPLPDGFLPPIDARLGTLSAGQRQRVALAITLSGARDLLLLDEPVANLDAEGRAAVWRTLGSLAEAGTAVLVASPAPGEMDGFAHRLLLLEDGRIVHDGPFAAPVPVPAPRPAREPLPTMTCEGGPP